MRSVDTQDGLPSAAIHYHKSVSNTTAHLSARRSYLVCPAPETGSGGSSIGPKAGLAVMPRAGLHSMGLLAKQLTCPGDCDTL